MGISVLPPQIGYLWVFQIHHHRFSSMGLDQFITTMDQTSMGISNSPPQIVYLWAFVTVISPSQIFIYEHLFQLSHHHIFSSMSICFSYFTTKMRHLWAFQIHHHRFSSMGFDQFSPPQIKHLWAFQIHQHRSNIYGHFSFTTINQTSMGISVVSPP